MPWLLLGGAAIVAATLVLLAPRERTKDAPSTSAPAARPEVAAAAPSPTPIPAPTPTPAVSVEGAAAAAAAPAAPPPPASTDGPVAAAPAAPPAPASTKGPVATAPAAPAPPAPRPERLIDEARPLAKALRARAGAPTAVLEGPAVAAMKNDRSPGRTWLARVGETTFRVTIQDAAKVEVDHVLAIVARLPARFRRCLEVVSEPGKDGVAIYAELGGAAAHGSQDYLNMIPAADVFVVMHEAGHVLEQRATKAQPDVLKRWADAIAADAISVSPYGDTITHEDQAEFALVHGIALATGPDALARLRALSPRRSALWEEILALAGASAPAGDAAGR